jgi:hypothetical protein
MMLACVLNPARTTKGLAYLYTMGQVNGPSAPTALFPVVEIVTALPATNPTTGTNPFFQ